MPAFFSLPSVDGGKELKVAGRAPVMVNSVWNITNAKAGKFAGNESWSVLNVGMRLYSGGAGAVPVKDFVEKLQL